MNLALATHTPEILAAPPVSLLAGSFVQRLGKARSLGYEGVELMVARPADLDASQIRTQLHAAGLKPAAVASGPVFMQERLTLLADTDEMMQSAAKRLMELVDFAAELEAPLVTVGSFRGRLAQTSSKEAFPRFKNTLWSAAERGQAKGVKLCLEPLNRYETDLVQDTAQGLGLLDEIGHPGLGLVLDTFHMNIEEADITHALRTAARCGRLWHIHLGDSNRQPPGQGHIDFPGIVRTLLALDYPGWFSAELLRGEDPDRSAELNIKYMRGLLNQANV